MQYDVWIKPYIKSVTIAQGETSSVTLTDTRGNAISCNYVRIFNPGAAATGDYLSVSANCYSASSGVVSSVPNTASGTCVLVVHTNTPGEFRTNGAALVSSVVINKVVGGTRPVLVIYGMEKPFNTLKFNFGNRSPGV